MRMNNSRVISSAAPFFPFSSVPSTSAITTRQQPSDWELEWQIVTAYLR